MDVIFVLKVAYDYDSHCYVLSYGPPDDLEKQVFIKSSSCYLEGVRQLCDIASELMDRGY